MSTADKPFPSIYDTEFLDPIYKRLGVGPILCLVCFSRCGGFRLCSLIKDKETLDKTLEDRKIFPHQAKIIVCFEPEELFKGYLNSDILELIWSYPKLDLLIFDDKDVRQNELDWIFENRGKYCQVFKDPKWHELFHRAFVPLADGKIEPGAY